MRKGIIAIVALSGIVLLTGFGYWYVSKPAEENKPYMPEVQILTLHDCGTYDSMAVCNLLQSPGSTTQYLKSFCPKNFNVLVLSQTWRDITHAEQARLHFTQNSIAYVREVLLRCGETNLMYAQSIFPETTIKATGNTFVDLGNQPLGEILFSDPNTERREWEINQVQPKDGLFLQMQNYFTAPQQFLWRKNSLIYFNQNPLLLEEVYLPPLLEPLRNQAT